MDSGEQYVITALVLLMLKQLGYNNIITMTLVCKFTIIYNNIKYDNNDYRLLYHYSRSGSSSQPIWSKYICAILPLTHVMVLEITDFSD